VPDCHKPSLDAANLSQGNKDHTAVAAVTLVDSASVSDAIHATAQPNPAVVAQRVHGH